MPLGPQDYVLAPPLTPPPNGLLRSATVIEHADETHWGGRLVWAPENALSAAAYDPCLGGPAGSFLDGVTTNSSTTFTSATATFTAADIGRTIVGTNIPAGTTIASVTNATTVVLSAAATASGTGLPFVIYGRLSANNRLTALTYETFAVDAYDQCSTFGFEAADYEGRARRALLARESKAVEAEFWRGAVHPANPHLDNSGANPAPPTTLASGTAQPLSLALSQLVQALADGNGGVGTIHARPFLVERWYGLYLLRQSTDGKLYTGNGNLVVPGTGYSGTGPAGQAVSATSEWAFATDMVEIHRGPVEVFANSPVQTMHRSQNTITIRAERLYGIAWNAIMNVAINVDPTQS